MVKMMIEIKDLSYHYAEGPQVLKDVSFSVGKGEIFGIIGPNGSGKSTLLKLITGTLPLLSGDIFIDGRSVRKMNRTSLASIFSAVPQTFESTFPFTAIEMVLMGRFIHRKGTFFESREDLEIARGAMRLTDTIGFESRYIQELSAGERQRVIIARALAQRPKILCLDEPTSSLDIKYQIAICDLVKKLKIEKGLTILMVLHDLNLAAMYCDRIVLLKNGGIFSTGTPRDIINSNNILEVYETEVRIISERQTDIPFIAPISKVF